MSYFRESIFIALSRQCFVQFTLVIYRLRPFHTTFGGLVLLSRDTEGVLIQRRKPETHSTHIVQERNTRVCRADVLGSYDKLNFAMEKTAYRGDRVSATLGLRNAVMVEQQRVQQNSSKDHDNFTFPLKFSEVSVQHPVSDSNRAAFCGSLKKHANTSSYERIFDETADQHNNISDNCQS